MNVPVSIMFVCTGNICRSPLAHRMLEKLAADRGLSDLITVESSGIDGWHVGEDADRRMRLTAEAHGLPLHHRARQLSPRDLEQFDLLFAMDTGHLRSIRTMAGARAPDLDRKVLLFRRFDPEVPEDTRSVPDTPDPYYGGADGFESVYRIVERTCAAILDALEDGRLGA